MPPTVLCPDAVGNQQRIGRVDDDEILDAEVATSARSEWM